MDIDEPSISVPASYLRELEKKVSDLKSLIAISSIISSEYQFTDLINIVMEKAKEVMTAEGCSILIYNRQTRKLEFEIALSCDDKTANILKQTVTLDLGQGIAGWVAKNLEPVLIEDVNSDERFYKGADTQTGFTTKSLIAVPLIGRDGLIGVAEIINPLDKESFNEYDTEIFQTLCRQVAVAIENSWFYEESIKRERLRQELEIASVVQRSFLPDKPSITIENIRVRAVNISAANVGGDVYDFITHCTGMLGVLIGDVSGKGVSAALYMAKFISDFRYVALKCESPSEVLNSLNSILQSAPRGMFITVTYLMIDIFNGELRIASAGHPPFLWFSSDKLTKISVPAGPPLGIFPAQFPMSTFKLLENDSILLMTDGVFEAKNRSGERIGLSNIVNFVGKQKRTDDLVTLLTNHVRDFTGDSQMADDLTLLQITHVPG